MEKDDKNIHFDTIKKAMTDISHGTGYGDVKIIINGGNVVRVEKCESINIAPPKQYKPSKHNY